MSVNLRGSPRTELTISQLIPACKIVPRFTTRLAEVAPKVCSGGALDRTQVQPSGATLRTISPQLVYALNSGKWLWHSNPQIGLLLGGWSASPKLSLGSVCLTSLTAPRTADDRKMSRLRSAPVGRMAPNMLFLF